VSGSGGQAWFSWRTRAAASPCDPRGGAALIASSVDKPAPGITLASNNVVDLDQDPARDGDGSYYYSLPFPPAARRASALLPHRQCCLAGSAAAPVPPPPIRGSAMYAAAFPLAWSGTRLSTTSPPRHATTHRGRPFDFFSAADRSCGRAAAVRRSAQLATTRSRGRQRRGVFDPQTEQGSFVAGMQHRPLYPTAADTLADGPVCWPLPD